ncbi:MAG TPA: endonuclease III domain-containing protein [Bacteroidetes bacterium]|nr:endonuclease III domain-containing protein [Bacteroidota bacterium]
MVQKQLNRDTLLEIYRHLLKTIGPRHWWPADGPFEVMVGAILTQNTAWANVKKAIANLKERGLLDPHKLQQIPERELAELIRPSGYFNQKAKKLKAFVEYFLRRFGGSVERMKQEDPEKLRAELLELYGIGPETADSILLYALEMPYFVIDAYTYRIFERHSWLNGRISYGEFQEFFHKNLPKDVALFNEFHALLDYVGHFYCRRIPNCPECPLRDWLPDQERKG